MIEKQEQVKIVEVWFKGHSTSNCEISGKVVGVCAVTLLCQIHYNSWNSANHYFTYFTEVNISNPKIIEH